MLRDAIYLGDVCEQAVEILCEPCGRRGRYNVAPGTNRKAMAIMEQTPLPISLDAARKLPWEPGRSAEVFVDGEIEVRFTPQPKDGTPHTHDRDELYFVASGRGFYRCDDKVTPVSLPQEQFTVSRNSRRISRSG